MTVSPSITMGALSDPLKLSPTLLRSESRGSLSRTESCVPAGMVTFCGGGGGRGGAGGCTCCDAGCGGGGALLLACSVSAEELPASLTDGLEWRRPWAVSLDFFSVRGWGFSAGCSTGGGGGVTCACCTCRLLTTVLTPSMAPASFAAAVRSASLVTSPLRVTTPLAACTLIPRLWMPGSL